MPDGDEGMTPMPQSVYRTMDDVVEGLGAWEARFRAAGDRRSIFLTLYGVVSAEIRERLAQGYFTDTQWVHRYAVAFANLYREALDAYDARRMADVPKAWRLCFDAAATGTGLVLQDMLLGVNAHVNHDLPFALSGVSIDPDRSRRYQDHAAVNAVLASVVDRATAQISALYAPGVSAMGDVAGQFDEMLSLFSLQVARESAWESAVSLANARSDVERRLAGTLIGSRAAVMARLLRGPSLSPSLLAACKRIEEGPEWLTIVAAATRRHHPPSLT